MLRRTNFFRLFQSNFCRSKMTVVLDIDGTLATPGKKIDSKTIRSSDEKIGKIIIAAEHEHHLYSYAPQSIRYLYNQPDVRVVFFSSGIKERNDEFVEKLSKLAIGSMPVGITILSRNDLIASKKNKIYALGYGEHKKNIMLALKGDCKIENAAIVEDDWSYVDAEQEKNLIYSPDPRLFSEFCIDEYFVRQNKMLFITGVLDICLLNFRRGIPVTKTLSLMPNILPDGMGRPYKPNYDLPKQRKFYEHGLSCLKTVDPNVILKETFPDVICRQGR